MRLDLEEQEQLANLKAFWMNHGRWILLGIAVVFLLYGGYWLYERQQVQKSLEASKIYSEMVIDLSQNDLPKAIQKTVLLQQQFTATPYAAMAGLATANLAYLASNTKESLAQLEWVEGKAKSESFQVIARLRMVAMLIDQKDEKSFAKANDLLNKKPVVGFEALQLERRGDWLYVQDKNPEAKKHYIQAWDVMALQRAKQAGLKEVDPMMKDLERRNPAENQRLLKAKIDSLGGFE
jgi:predicted negative regulator of RcsB-dependent stress response